MLLCENNTYYTGYTNDLAARYASHINASGKCKYTRSFKPLNIAQCWQISGDKSQALKLERYIKTLSRSDKEKLILQPMMLSEYAVPVSVDFLKDITERLLAKT